MNWRPFCQRPFLYNPHLSYHHAPSIALSASLYARYGTIWASIDAIAKERIILTEQPLRTTCLALAGEYDFCAQHDRLARLLFDDFAKYKSCLVVVIHHMACTRIQPSMTRHERLFGLRTNSRRRGKYVLAIGAGKFRCCFTFWTVFERQYDLAKILADTSSSYAPDSIVVLAFISCRRRRVRILDGSRYAGVANVQLWFH